MVIPSDAVSAIASRLVSPDSASPMLFRLPDNYHLDRLTVPLSREYLACSPFCRPGYPICPQAARQTVSLTWAQQGSSELQNALNGELALPPRPLYVPSQDGQRIRPPSELPTPPALPLPVPSPPSPPRGVVRRRQRHGRATSAPPVFRTLKSSQRRGPSLKDPRQCFTRNRSSPEVPTRRLETLPSNVLPVPAMSETPPSMEESQEDHLSNGGSATGLVLPPPSVHPPVPQSTFDSSDEAAPESHPQVSRLGNLYLSSCPGKKGEYDSRFTFSQ